MNVESSSEDGICSYKVNIPESVEEGLGSSLLGQMEPNKYGRESSTSTVYTNQRESR